MGGNNHCRKEKLEARINAIKDQLDKDFVGSGNENDKLTIEKLQLEAERDKLVLEEVRLAKDKLDEENLKLKSEKELVTTTEWLDAQLPAFPVFYRGSCSKWGGKPEWFPKAVGRWKNFEEAARASTAESAGFHSLHKLDNVADGDVDSEAGSSFCLKNVLVSLLRVCGYAGCIVDQLFVSYRSDKEGLAGDEKHVDKLAKTGRLVPDLVLRKTVGEGCKGTSGIEFLVVEMKKPRFFRDSGEGKVPDLVESCEKYMTPGGQRDDLHVSGILQLLTYMVNLKLRYGVLSTSDISYFVRLVKVEDEYDCLEISQGVTWRSRDPTLARAFHYVVHTALDEMGNKEFQFGKGGEPWIHSPDEIEDFEDLEERKGNKDKAYRPSSSRTSSRNTVVVTRSRDGPQESAASDHKLEDFPASFLNLEEYPFATEGWSGNVTRGRVYGQPVAVKLAPKYSDRGEALEVEGIVYKELRKYWGQYLPKLVAHGTTNRGEIVFLATEFINGYAIGPKSLTKAVAREARSALQAVHNAGRLHGDIQEENILIIQGSVRLIDFGFAKPFTSIVECDKEVEELEEILRKKRKLLAPKPRATSLYKVLRRCRAEDNGKAPHYRSHNMNAKERCGKTGIVTSFINKNQSETILLDLKHLLKEAKRRIPPVLEHRKKLEHQKSQAIART